MNHWWRKVFNNNHGVRPEVAAADAAAVVAAASAKMGKQPSGAFEINVQPGSARFAPQVRRRPSPPLLTRLPCRSARRYPLSPSTAVAQAHHVVGGEFDDGVTDATYTPRSGAESMSPVRRRLARQEASPRYVD